MIRVPFENVSKLYRIKQAGLRGLPGLERHLDGIELHNFGGTCYANNYYFYLLLTHAGYDIMLCGADMDTPDAHIVSMVTVDGREYLVDVGYAAPFLKPLPRDLTQDHVVSLGRDRYVLKPQDRDGGSLLELYRDGRLMHGYTAKPIPRRIEHFAHGISDSFTDGSNFMNALLLVRFFPNSSLVIHNFTLIRSEGTESRIHRLANREELTQAINDHFAIPGAIAAEAVAGLGRFRDAWGQSGRRA